LAQRSEFRHGGVAEQESQLHQLKAHAKQDGKTQALIFVRAGNFRREQGHHARDAQQLVKVRTQGFQIQQRHVSPFATQPLTEFLTTPLHRIVEVGRILRTPDRSMLQRCCGAHVQYGQAVAPAPTLAVLPKLQRSSATKARAKTAATMKNPPAHDLGCSNLP
jgi:hypothetical protein